MKSAFFNKEYISLRVILSVVLIMLINLTWTLITVVNGGGFGALADQLLLTRTLMGAIETFLLVEASFYSAWAIFGPEKTPGKKSYFLALLLLVTTIIVFSLGFGLLEKISFQSFTVNCISDLAIAISSFVVSALIIQKDSVNKLLKEKEKYIEEKARNAEATALAQADAINMRIDNHFFFNSLNILAALIPEDPKKAEDFLLELTDAHRLIFIEGSAKSISISKEMKLLDAYMKMTRYRFGTDSISLTIDDEISEHEEEHVIPLSILHGVENAIKHNNYSNEKPLRISISVEADANDYYFIIISNNKQEKFSKPISTKQGIENIRKKYLLVSGQCPIIENNEETFTLKLPIIKQWTY